jgi:hypothetical protein
MARGLLLPGHSQLRGASLVRPERGERRHNLCTQSVHRLQYTREALIAKSIESGRFAFADSKHTRQTRPRFRVLHTLSLRATLVAARPAATDRSNAALRLSDHLADIDADERCWRVRHLAQRVEVRLR